MEGHLVMSKKERERLQALGRVQDGELTLVGAAAQLCLSYRQMQRIAARYRQHGDVGLVHGLRGRASPQALPTEFRAHVLEICRLEMQGYGPSHARDELLRRYGISLGRETLRKWLNAEGLRASARKSPPHRTWRARKARFGEMVQMDGSWHRWYGDGKSMLMDMVDDATGVFLGEFHAQETTASAMNVLQSWIRRYGVPVSLYVDRRTVYVTDREPNRDEQLRGEPALTQFGRACRKLGIRIIAAHSPQAKGRIERRHGVLQDRLVKEMATYRIDTMAGANAYLSEWTPRHNDQTAIRPASPEDLHRDVPPGLDLRTVFCHEEHRSVGADGTIRFGRQVIQILKQTQRPATGRRVTVQRWHDGSIHVFFAEHELTTRVVAEPIAAQRSRSKPAPAHATGAGRTVDHSWRTGAFVPHDTTPLQYQHNEVGLALGSLTLGEVVLTVHDILGQPPSCRRRAASAR